MWARSRPCVRRSGKHGSGKLGRVDIIDRGGGATPPNKRMQLAGRSRSKERWIVCNGGVAAADARSVRWTYDLQRGGLGWAGAKLSGSWQRRS